MKTRTAKRRKPQPKPKLPPQQVEVGTHWNLPAHLPDATTHAAGMPFRGNQAGRYIVRRRTPSKRFTRDAVRIVLQLDDGRGDGDWESTYVQVWEADLLKLGELA